MTQKCSTMSYTSSDFWLCLSEKQMPSLLLTLLYLLLNTLQGLSVRLIACIIIARSNSPFIPPPPEQAEQACIILHLWPLHSFGHIWPSHFGRRRHQQGNTLLLYGKIYICSLVRGCSQVTSCIIGKALIHNPPP